ncbi:MAG: sensor histidine kinase [Pseudomonadales bacterium]
MAGTVHAQLRDLSQDAKRLRWLLLGLLLALLLPTSILAIRAYSQLGYESLYRYRLSAENVAQAIESQVSQLLAVEAARGVEQFEFYLPQGGQAGAERRRSPLAELSDVNALPGTLGYFQVDAQGRFSTPLLPDAAADLQGLSLAERQERTRRQEQITGLLAVLAELGSHAPTALSDVDLKRERNEGKAEDFDLSGAAAPAPAEAAVFAEEERDARAPASVGKAQQTSSEYAAQTNQRVFDRLVSRRQDQAASTELVLDDEAVADKLLLEKSFLRSQKQKQEAPQAKMDQRAAGLRQAVPQGAVVSKDFGWLSESQLSLQYLSIDDAHFLLFRRWWQAGNPVVQGVLVQREGFLQSLVDAPFASSSVSGDLQLTLTEQNQAIRRVNVPTSGATVVSSAAYPKPVVDGGELLYRTRLPVPLNDLQLVFSARQQGLPVGGSWIIWSCVVLLSVLLGGFTLIYRFGLQELARRQTQQNFVSAVSHELKTPLTAIRMYGEMLKSGWVSEDKKPGYYEFIFSESERLSRLISNVLRLSQISRDKLALTLEPRSVAQLLDIARSKLQSLAEQSGVELRFDLPSNLADARVAVDEDAFAQVLINLADNAVKFAAEGEHQQVDIFVQGLPSNLPQDRTELCLSVRDYGPGIPKAQLARIFDLFYRGESELTRKTQGTGIGLALVAELVAAMHGRVEARNCEPGAQFSLYLPLSP